MILLALFAAAVGILSLGIFIGVWLSDEHGADPEERWEQFQRSGRTLFPRDNWIAEMTWLRCGRCHRWFGRHGLVGDGHTDDTIALQQRIDAGMPLDGETLGHRTFKISSQIQFGRSLRDEK